jgi:hypothetical protein
MVSDKPWGSVLEFWCCVCLFSCFSALGTKMKELDAETIAAIVSHLATRSRIMRLHHTTNYKITLRTIWGQC